MFTCYERGFRFYRTTRKIKLVGDIVVLFTNSPVAKGGQSRPRMRHQIVVRKLLVKLM
jgi:hypothetical protein